MPTRKPNLKSFKGETFGLSPDVVERAMSRAKEMDYPWVLLISGDVPDGKRREIAQAIDNQYEWYDWEMNVRNKPIEVSDGESMEEFENYNNDEPSPVVAKNATSEPQRTRAVDRLKGRRK